MLNVMSSRAMDLGFSRSGKNEGVRCSRTGRREETGWGILKEGDHLENLDGDGRMILKNLLKKKDMKA
jgi:hypothetical protein